MSAGTEKGDTKTRILAVAIELFAAHGCHGATVDGIVHRARVNKRMVYHWFGSKKQLDETVPTDIYRRRGVVRADVNARRRLIGLCQIYTSNRHTLSRALNMDLGATRVLGEGKKRAFSLLLNGIMV